MRLRLVFTNVNNTIFTTFNYCNYQFFSWLGPIYYVKSQKSVKSQSPLTTKVKTFYLPMCLKKVQKQYKKPSAIIKKCGFCLKDSPLRMTCWGTKEMSRILSRWVLAFLTDDWKEFHQEWILKVLNLVENVMKFQFYIWSVIRAWNYFSEVIL